MGWCNIQDLSPPVIRYTFALMSPDQTEGRVRIGEFPRPESAIQLAELIAAEMALEESREWAGWTLEVRGAEGSKLLTVPVGSGSL